jgi:hypothetical protein
VGFYREEFRKRLPDGSYLELELGGQLRWILVHGGALAGGVQLRALCRYNADVGRAPVLFTEKFTLSTSNFHAATKPTRCSSSKDGYDSELTGWYW